MTKFDIIFHMEECNHIQLYYFINVAAACPLPLVFSRLKRKFSFSLCLMVVVLSSMLQIKVKDIASLEHFISYAFC